VRDDRLHVSRLANDAGGGPDSGFGEIGDQRLTVMAAITFADELVEVRKQLDGLKDEVAALRDAQAQLAAVLRAAA